MTLVTGEKYDWRSLQFTGWTGNDEIYDEHGNRNPGMDGFSVADYFDHDGTYKGPDINDVEPTFADRCLVSHATCIYCDHDDISPVVPAVNDDQGWEELTHEHAADCEWVLTRAHRRVVLCGNRVQVDRSGVGHNWRTIDPEDIPANIREEIAAEIVDGRETCDLYVASNGVHYRW